MPTHAASVMSRSSVLDREGARRADLAKIHMAKKALGWDDGQYREILWSVCRARSSAELDFAGRKRMLDHLAKCGWKARPGGTGRSLAADPQSKMIRGLWLELHEMGYVRDPSEAALSSWLRRETRVQALQWLEPVQAQRTIEKLKQWRDRDASRVGKRAAELVLQGRLQTDNVEQLALTWCGSPRLTRESLRQIADRLEELSRA